MHRLQSALYGRELYYCECHSIHNHFYYQVVYQRGQYEPGFKCNKCKSSLKRLKFSDNPGVEGITDLQDNNVTLKCPKCVEGILGIYSLIMWD